ncbi:HEPN domain-containing protein [Micromonospora sp. WMMC273]|uniref:ApeA N-terminal domain 1-containing protein n=1 Tax=Micromonospora sp. WMMC273 TaxID=3015157 RepID=UPI0022B6F9B7|nr:HEPN domain-containing protein [Micromonospora sp. WMMC273]MCZ7478371.1 hypothetical protein [Micromonospora sp. WMMC273]
MERGEKRTAEWWLPDMNPEDAVPGTYEVTENGQVRVELHRALPNQGLEDLFSNEDIEYPLIHGAAFGLPVTLINSRAIGRKASLTSRHVNTTLRPWVAVEGIRLNHGELCLTDATVRVENQDLWDNYDSFRPSALRKSGFPSTFTYTPLQTEIAEIPGGEISVEDASAYHPQGSNLSLQSRSKFKLKFDKEVSFEDFAKRHIRSLLLMMTAATGRDCGVLEVRCTSSEWVVKGERHPGDRWVIMRVGKSSQDTKPLSIHDLLFNLGDLDWKTQAPHFFDITDEWAYPIELWASLASSKLFWPLARFANSVQAVEALDRILYPAAPFTPDTELAERVNEALKEAHFNKVVRSKVKESLLRPREASLDARMTRLAERVSVAMEALVGEHAWEQRIARLRHVASHGLEDAEQFVGDTRAPEVATEVLLHLLECLFLERVGFTPTRIAELQERRSSSGYRKLIVHEYLPLLDAFSASRSVKPNSGESQS